MTSTPTNYDLDEMIPVGFAVYSDPTDRRLGFTYQGEIVADGYVDLDEVLTAVEDEAIDLEIRRVLITDPTDPRFPHKVPSDYEPTDWSL